MTVNDLTVCAFLRPRWICSMRQKQFDVMQQQNASALCFNSLRYAGWLNIPVWLPSPSHWHTPYPSLRWCTKQYSPVYIACWTCNSAATLHSAQRATTVRNGTSQQRTFATRSCNVRTSWRHSHYIHVGEDWYPFNTNISQQQPDTQYSQASTNSQASSTLKQARTMNSTLKQEHSTQILKQDLARARTGIVNNCITIMIDILAFYNV